MNRWFNLISVNGLVALLLLILTELIYSSIAWLLVPPSDVWLFEHLGKTVHFDPVKGYQLTTTPSRFTRIINGQSEYVGQFQGNAQGMPDRDDFTAQRSYPESRRLAVFGDSYSAGQYLEMNWPDRIEVTLQDVGIDLKLFNFSTHGAGLANWVSNLSGLLIPENYVVDGLIFAVYGNDLNRTFFISDGRRRRHYAYAQIESWDPAHYPKNRHQAKPLLDAGEISNGWIVTRDEFDGMLEGTRQLPQPWTFKVWEALNYYLPRWWNLLNQPLHPPLFSSGQKKLVDNIRDYAQLRSLPVMVVYVPGREEAGTQETNRQFDAAVQFAEWLDAVFVDGRKAFANIDADALKSFWFENDKHWNQAGSDRFAAYMSKQLPGFLAPTLRGDQVANSRLSR